MLNEKKLYLNKNILLSGEWENKLCQLTSLIFETLKLEHKLDETKTNQHILYCIGANGT